MGVKITVARFATPTSTGNQTWTDTNLGGLTPEAIMVIGNHADTDGTVETDVGFWTGFADGTNEGGTGGWSGDALTTTDSTCSSSSTQVINFFHTQTAQVVATFVSFQADSVTLNFSTVDSDAQLYTVVFFAGTDLSATVGYITGTTDITTIGFNPDLVLFTAAYSQNDPANHNVGGFAAAVSGTERGLCYGTNDGQAASVTNSVLTTTLLINGPFNNGSNHTWTTSAFDANGFTATVSSGTRALAYLALNFGGEALVSLRSFDSPTTTGDDPRTGVGFTPQFVLLAMGPAAAEDTIEVDGDAGAFGISVFTADAEYSNSWADEDNPGTTNCQSLADDQAINLALGDGTTQHAATFVSMNTDGHTLNYSTANGTARKWFEVAIESREISSNKRRSAGALWWDQVRPLADSSITAPDRANAGWNYSGIAIDAGAGTARAPGRLSLLGIGHGEDR